jgi:hypothetical protein
MVQGKKQSPAHGRRLELLVKELEKLLAKLK